MSDPFDKTPTVAYATPEHLAPGVRRVTCRNPSPYTFTGTQSYLVGTGEVALIDPGPNDSEHLQALLAALQPGERISHIIVTHTHQDHSPGASVLAHETGAPIHAHGRHGTGITPTMQTLIDSGTKFGGGEGADVAFAPDHLIADGQTITGGDWALSAIHTPGHLSNHLSFALDGTGMVFTGDIVMGWATTLVSPPEGDMAAFMASLERLAARTGDSMYLPGHGHAITDPAGMLAHQKAHRLQRFAQIIAALEDGPQDPTSLTRTIYTDVDPALLPAARRNVFASLIGLYDEGRVGCSGPISADAVFHLA